MTPTIAKFGTLHADDDFNVRWDDPGEAKLTWVWDPGHFPYPLVPLAIDRARKSMVAMQEAMGIPEEKRLAGRVINGYVFGAQPLGGGGLGSPSAAPSKARKRQIAEDARDPWGKWKREWEPEIRDLLEPIKSDDLSSVPYSEMAGNLGRLFEESARATARTMSAAQVMFAASNPFVQYCKTDLGEDGELRAATMMGGYANYSTASDRAFWDLAKKLRESSNAARALDDLRRGLDTLDSVTGRMASQYLDRWGWRSSIWGNLTIPAWRIDPIAFFDTLRQYVDELPEDPRKALRRAAGRRRSEVTKTRRQLTGKKLEQFNRLLEAASIYVPLREARAYWQMVSGGVIGVPCRGVGARLVEGGVIDQADDVFYLGLDEIQEATNGGSGGRWAGLVEERRTEYAKYLKIVPPVTVGAPFEGDPQELLDRAGHFKGTEEGGTEAAEDRILRGTAASRGTVRGTARLIRSLDEADRLKEGEILVVRTSSPPWTPLIARSAGVVAETGGILMHCAIVTREYAIPCVVGVGPVDGRIEDGDIITVDGSQGVVRVE